MAPSFMDMDVRVWSRFFPAAFVLPVLCAASLLACGAETPRLRPSGYTAPASSQPAGAGDARALFSEDRLHEFAIRIAPEVYARLVADALKEEYVPAEVTVDGVDVGKVGFRFKGSNGSLLSCFRDGRQICPKAALKIKFDELDAGKRLFGEKRINLHAFVEDPSLMHERLALELFHAMDIPAPRAAHARVTLNGQYVGLYLAVEEIDGRFTSDRWPRRGDGNLYKEIWPGNSEPPFDHALRTNEERPDHRSFTAINNLVRASRPEVLPAILDEWLDAQHLARYLVVDEAINNWDGVRAFYCDSAGQYCGNHNFFWYQDQLSNRFWLVPWDLTSTFRLYDPFWRVPRWRATGVDCSVRYPTPDGVPMRPAACDRVLSGLARSQGAALEDARRRLVDVWDLAALGAKVQRWAAQLAQAVETDDRGPGPGGFRLAQRELLRDLEVGRAALAEAMPPAAEGSETVGLYRNTFEGVDRSTFLRRTQLTTNRRSGALHDLNGEQPIAGTRDVRIDFELDNTLDTGAGTGNDVGKPIPYSQVAVLRLPFRSGTSLREARRVRFSVKSAVARTIALVIEGARAWQDTLHPQLGASIETRIGTAEYTVELDAFKPTDEKDTSFDAGARAALLDRPLALLFQILPVGALGGLLPAGHRDVGSIQLDDVVIE